MENVTFSPSTFSTAIKPTSFKTCLSSELRSQGEKNEDASFGESESQLESFRMNLGLPRTMDESTLGEMNLESTKISTQSNVSSSSVLPLLTTTSSGMFALHLSESRNEDVTFVTTSEEEEQHSITATSSQGLEEMNQNRSSADSIKHEIAPSQTESHTTLTPSSSGQNLDPTPPPCLPVKDLNLSPLTLEARSWINSSNKTFHSYLGSSMIENETEPTVIREAAEFSLFEPRASGGCGQSTGYRGDSDGVKMTEESMSRQSKELLPCSDGGNGQSLNVKMAEETITTQVGLSAYLVPSTPIDSLMERTQDSREMDSTANDVHNPFDSDSDFSQDFEKDLGKDLDIGMRDIESVLSELKLDEQLLNQETPPSINGTFTVPSSNFSGLTVPGEGGDVSLTTYFKEKSYPLGASLSANNSISERPLFSTDHQIISPPSRPLPPISEPTESDTPPSVVVSSSPLSQEVTPLTSAVDLTPLVTTVSPGTANMPIPKLDLAKLLSDVSSTTIVSSPECSITDALSRQNHSNPETASSSGQSKPSHDQLTTANITVSNLKASESPRLPLTPSPRSAEIPSLYFRESCGSSMVEDSTIMVSDVSAFPLTPAPSRPQFDVTANLPTPSMVGTTQLFNFTQVDDTFEDVLCAPGGSEKGDKDSPHPPPPSDVRAIVNTGDKAFVNTGDSTLVVVHHGMTNGSLPGSSAEGDTNGVVHTEHNTVCWASSSSSSKGSSDASGEEDMSPVTVPKRQANNNASAGSVTLDQVGGDSDSSSSCVNEEDLTPNKRKEVGLTPPTVKQEMGLTLQATCNSGHSITTSAAVNAQQSSVSDTATLLPNISSPQSLSLSFTVLDKPQEHSGQSTSSNSPKSSSLSPSSPSATPSPLGTGSSHTPSPPSVNTLVTQSATKRARIKAILDATRFDAQKFLSSLEIRPLSQAEPQALITHSVSLPAVRSGQLSQLQEASEQIPSSLTPRNEQQQVFSSASSASSVPSGLDTSGQLIGIEALSQQQRPHPSSNSNPSLTPPNVQWFSPVANGEVPNQLQTQDLPVSSLTPFVTTLPKPELSDCSDVVVTPLDTNSLCSVPTSSSQSGSQSETTNGETLKQQDPLLGGNQHTQTVTAISNMSSACPKSTNQIYSSSHDQFVHNSPVDCSAKSFSPHGHTPVATLQSHTPINCTIPYKTSLPYATPMLSSEAQTSFHALSMTNTPLQPLPSISPPNSYLVTPLLATKPPSPPLEIEAPEVVTFKGVSCVFTKHFCQFTVRNKTDRWIQSKLNITAIRRNTDEVVTDTHKIFDSPSKCFIGPKKEELVKISFTPFEPGSYTAILRLIPHVSSSIALPLSSHTLPLATIKIQALAEEPKVQVLTSGDNPSILDYGVVLAKNVNKSYLPLYLINHGKADVPLSLVMAMNTPSWFCFSFGSSTGSASSNNSVAVPLENHDSNTRSVRITLPGKLVDQVESTVHSLMVHFAPVVRSSSHDLFSLSHPEEFSSRIDLFIDSPADSTEDGVPIISSLQLKATVGVARLHAPRSMQYISLSCDLGSTITQSIPIKNAGNVPLRVKMYCDHEEWFTARPDHLDMQPEEESHVQVQFRPLQPSTVFEGTLQMSTEPTGPTYHIKLRGVAKDPAPVLQEAPVTNNGLLECNRHSLFWTSVDIGQSSMQDLVIRSTYNTRVVLEAKVRDPEIFKLQTSSSPLSMGLKISLDPVSQDTLHVQYTPSSNSLQKSYIDIMDTVHNNRRYEIPVFGYGGSSCVSVTNCLHTDHGLVACLGEVRVNRQSVVKLRLANTGQRAAFVRVMGYPATDGVTNDPLPMDRLQIVPEKIMIHPQQSREVVLIFCCKGDDPASTQPPGDTIPLVKLVLYTGDEIVRRLVTSLLSHDTRGEESHLLTALRGYFTEQDTVPSDFEHVPLEGIRTKNLLESHTKAIQILLTGQMASPAPPAPPTHLPLPPPSHYSSASSSSSAPPLSNRVLPSHSVKFAETAVNHFGESFLEIHNPYPVLIKWWLSTSSPSFVKEVEGSGSLHKAKYSPFWVYQCAGEISPSCRTAVMVTFQPQDVGSYTQIWNLEVQGESIGVKRFTLSFSGQCFPAGPGQNLFPVASVSSAPPSNQVDLTSLTARATREMPSVSSQQHSHNKSKKAVYLGSDHLEFPVTEVGRQEMLKLRVFNRDTCDHQFQIIKPQSPFSVLHYEFELKSSKYARLPIYFSPSEESQTYESVIAVRTRMGHQMFAVLTGRSA